MGNSTIGSERENKEIDANGILNTIRIIADENIHLTEITTMNKLVNNNKGKNQINLVRKSNSKKQPLYLITGACRYCHYTGSYLI